MNNYVFKNLSVPTKKIDVVLDTDAFNEIDDQYAIAYMLKSMDKLNVKASLKMLYLKVRIGIFPMKKHLLFLRLHSI